MKVRELLYTSAARGLKPGTTGFSTVMMTRGLAGPAVELLERLSNNYQVLYLPYDPRARENPVAFSLMKARAGSQALTVLSRNAAAGADHTGRSNFLAHHLLIDGETPPGVSPADAALDPDAFRTSWNEEPTAREPRALDPFGDPIHSCVQWKQVTGNERWAARLAQTWTGETPAPLYIIYPPGTNVLALIREAIGLLPEGRQWGATFTTYYCGLPPGVTCQVRGVLEGTAQEAEARRGEFLDLTSLRGPVPSGRWADRACGIITAEPMAFDAPPPLAGETLPASLRADRTAAATTLPVATLTVPLADEAPPPVDVAPSRRRGYSQGSPLGDDRFAPAPQQRTPIGFVLSPPGWLFWLTVLLFAGILAMFWVGKLAESVMKEDEYKNSVQTLNSEYEAKLSEVAAARKKAEERVKELSPQVDDLEKRLSEKSKDYDGSRANLTRLDSDIAKLKSEKTNQDADIKRLTVQLEVKKEPKDPPPKKEEPKADVAELLAAIAVGIPDIKISHDAGTEFGIQNVRGLKVGDLKIVGFVDGAGKSSAAVSDPGLAFQIVKTTDGFKAKAYSRDVKNPKYVDEKTTKDTPKTIKETTTIQAHFEQLDAVFFHGARHLIRAKIVKDGDESDVFFHYVSKNAKSSPPG